MKLYKIFSPYRYIAKIAVDIAGRRIYIWWFDKPSKLKSNSVEQNGLKSFSSPNAAITQPNNKKIYKKTNTIT